MDNTTWLRIRRGRRLHSVGLVSIALVVGLAAGCVVPGGTDQDAPDRPDMETTMPPEMVPELVSQSVLAAASEDLNVPIAELSILRVNSEVWSDGCLGLGQANELCLQALVPGWQLEVVHNDQSYFYRTDERGEVIRRSTLENNLPPSIGEKVINLAASELGMPAEQLQVIRSEPRVWDGCLGVEAPGTPCTEIAIFGWRAVVEGNGETLVYHTDMTGDDIRLNDL